MNLGNLTYRQKNRLLLVGSLLACVLIYVVSLSQTWELYRANQALILQVENARNAPAVILGLKKQLASYNRILKNFSSDTLRREDYILDQITNSCKRNGIRLVSLPVSNLSEQEDFLIETRMIKMKGSFINLLRVVYEAEHQFMVGRVSSVRFATEEDRKNNTVELFAYVYLQNLSLNKNESQ